MRRALVPLLIILAVWAARPARGGEPAAKRLETPIDVNFVSTPLERALEHVCRRANVAMVVDKRGLIEDRRRFPVSLQARNRPAQEVLDLLAREAGVGYRLDGHVVFVTSIQRARRDEVVMRTYDVRDLTGDVPDFPGPELSFEEDTSSVGAGFICLLDDEAVVDFEAGSIGDLIRERVSPGQWAAELGTSIEERDGLLFVMQTKEIHSKIEDMLAEFRASAGPFLRLDAKVVLADAAELSTILRRSRTPGILAADERATLETDLARLGAVPLACARTMCVNNQRNHVVSGIVTPYTADCEISSDMPDPVVRRFLSGTSMDVLPVVSHDRSAVRMTVRLATSVQSGPTYRHTVLTGPAVAGGERTLSETVEVKREQEKQVHTATSTTREETHIPGPVRLEQPRIVTRKVNTDVMVRDGATAYFTVDAWQEVGGPGKAVLVLLRPKVLGAVAGN